MSKSRKRKPRKRKPGNQERPKTKLGLPDLDHSLSAVLDSLRSPESKRGYQHPKSPDSAEKEHRMFQSNQTRERRTPPAHPTVRGTPLTAKASLRCDEITRRASKVSPE